MKGWIWMDDTWIRGESIKAFSFRRKKLYRRAELVIDIGAETPYRFGGDMAQMAFEFLEKKAREDSL